MTPDPNARPLTALGTLRNPHARGYALAGLVALAVTFFVMTGRGSGAGAMILMLIGAPGVLLRWATAAALYLMFLTYFLADPSGVGYLNAALTGDRSARISLGPPTAEGLVLDIALAGSSLAFVICHFRVMTLSARAFPPEGRAKADRAGDLGPAHAAALPEDGALAGLPAAVGLSAAAGLFALLLTRNAELPVAVGRRWQEFFFALWPLLGGAMLANGALTYQRFRRMTPGQARRYLEDVFWQETDREQRRIHVWRVWAAGRRGREGGTA